MMALFSLLAPKPHLNFTVSINEISKVVSFRLAVLYKRWIPTSHRQILTSHSHHEHVQLTHHFHPPLLRN
jgi:hypothetical protein